MGIKNLYLILFNLASSAGWSYVLFLVARHYAEGGAVDGAYAVAGKTLQVVQTMAIMEVVHAMTGIVRSPWVTTAIQVASRLFLVWGICDAVPEVTTHWLFSTMVVSWCLTEIGRYLFYALTLLGNAPHWLKVVRYSTFAPLYPTGAGSEWGLLLLALPSLQQTRPFCLDLPNQWNFSFDYPFWCQIMVYVYLPGLPYMYMHMVKQRARALNPKPKAKSA